MTFTFLLNNLASINRVLQVYKDYLQKAIKEQNNLYY
jgi:hypothetical protein